MSVEISEAQAVTILEWLQRNGSPQELVTFLDAAIMAAYEEWCSPEYREIFE